MKRSVAYRIDDEQDKTKQGNNDKSKYGIAIYSPKEIKAADNSLLTKVILSNDNLAEG